MGASPDCATNWKGLKMYEMGGQEIPNTVLCYLVPHC